MEFMKLPSNSRMILEALINAKNPTQELCERWNTATGPEVDELKGIITELRQRGYIDVLFADNKPYIVTLTNAARTYNEQLTEYESETKKQEITCVIDQSIKIGDKNKIKNSNIFGTSQNNQDSKSCSKKKFSEKHPVLVNVIISVIIGFIFLFSFWDNIVNWIEGFF